MTIYASFAVSILWKIEDLFQIIDFSSMKVDSTKLYILAMCTMIDYTVEHRS